MAQRSQMITAPGKFEGEQDHVPYFWDLYLDGGADEIELFGDDGEVLKFYINDDDVAHYPALKGLIYIKLAEDTNGFVHEVGRR